LEGLWRKTRNATLQGLIMLAAAFVKLQEGQPDKFERMLKEALHLLKEDVGCIKMGRLLEKAEKALLEKRPFQNRMSLTLATSAGNTSSTFPLNI